MAKSALPPMSPTVHTVFTEFLKKLEADATCTKEALGALKLSLETQTLDPQSLREALFKEASSDKS